MARQRILFSITVNGETINFVERSLGSRGRDILAIKLALGVLTNTTQIQNSSPQDFSIGKSWFDCDTGQEVSSTAGILFNEKMKSRLMTYQIQNQFVILSYYFEKYMIRNVNTKEELLAQILNAEQIFSSELGNIGEGTLACLHGWVPSSDLKNEGFYIDAETVQQVPMYLFESVADGAIAIPERISRILDPNPQAPEDRGALSRIKTDFRRFYRSYRDIQNKIEETVGWAIYKIPSSESELYTGSRQVALQLDRELGATESVKTRKEIESLSLRALEPNPLTDPDPFIINNKLIGAFFRTDYTLESLPPVLGPSEVRSLEELSLSRILSYYSKSISSSVSVNDIINFVDLRTPSLRPGDVYRAYFEINKIALDALEDADTTQTPEQIAALSAEIIERKIAAGISTIEESFCALGTDIEEEQARAQYQKYRAFATKNKRELVRELRSAAARAASNSEDISGGITADLGPFGNVNLSDTQILASGLNLLVGAVRSSDPNESPTLLKIRYNDLVRQLDLLKDEFQKAQPDLDNYKLSNPLFSAQEEAANIEMIKPGLDGILNDSEEMKELSKSTGRSISDIVKKAAYGGFISAEISFSFEDSEAGSILNSVTINVEGRDTGNILPNPKPSIFNLERTVHYLRNIDNLTGAGSAVGALCEDETSTQAGLGANYVLKYTKDVGITEKIPGEYNPIHNPLEDADLEVQRFAEQYRSSNRSVFDTFVSPTAYGVSEVLPLIGPDCGDFDNLKQFVSTRQLEKYICDYISCLRLPEINIKIPNLDFKLPDIPDLPTFSWPGLMSATDFYEMLKEIAKRLICRFVNAILDILRTPFCGDQMIEDLYGAGSNQVSPAIKQALGDTLSDVGIPASKFDELSGFMDDLTKLLTPRELCALLEGEPVSQEILSMIRRTAEKNDISEFFTRDADIHRIFVSLGAFLDPQFCDDLNSINDALSQYSCDSPSDVISQIRNRIARNEDVSDDDITRATNLAQKNYEDKASQLEAMLQENGLGAAFPEVIYGPGNPDALINQLPAPVLESAQEMAETIFEAPKMSYISSLKTFIPSMFLSVPAKAEPGDPNFDPRATMLVQRHSNNLDAYSRSGLGQALDGTNRLQILSRRLEILYYDYHTEEVTLVNGDVVEIYREIDRIGPDGTTIRSLMTIYERAPEGGVLVPKINPDEIFPIRLSRPFQGINSIMTFEELDRFTNSSNYFYDDDEDVDTQYTSDMAASDIQLKIGERLQQMNNIIQNNLDKAFGTTNKSEFLVVLKQFYNRALERTAEGTAAEVIDYTDEENTLILREPPRAGFNSRVLMKDVKFEGNKLPYTVSVDDDFFLGASKDFSYCDEIPPEYLAYEGVSGNSYPRRQLFTQLYLQNLKKKAQEYGPEGQDLSAFGLEPEQNGNFQELLYTDVYARTAEGLVEQLRDYVANSRLFNSEDYLNRLGRVVEGMSYYDESSGCVKNRFNLIGKSELDFDKIIAFDFMSEFQRELGRPENSALSIDPSKQGPVELAVANTVVKAYIRLCILELILKGAITLSVWDLEYIISDEFFTDYVYEFIVLEVERNSTFSKNMEQFDDALFRVTGISNKHLALKTIINAELSTFVSLSKNIYDHDPSLDHSDWFANILPLVNVSDKISENPQYEGQFDHPLEESEIPSRINAFSHLERYVRIEGPLANVSNLVSGQYQAAQQRVSEILDKLRDTSLAGPQMPRLEDYLMDGTEEELKPLRDQDRFRELVSPEEFRFLLEDVLQSNGQVDRYLSDLLNQIGPDQTSMVRLFGQPKAVTRTPLRAIRRKRSIIRISDEDLITSNNGRCFEDFFNNRDVSTENQNDIARQFSNISSDEDRFYIVPVDGIESEDKRTFDSDFYDVEEYLSEDVFGRASFFKENFLIEENRQETVPEATTRFADANDEIGRKPRGYTLSKVKAASEDSRNPDRRVDPLDPTAPWIVSSRTVDRLSRFDGPRMDQNTTEEIIFKNHYGEVSEDIWNRHLEDVPSIQEETWNETVIDLVLDASPVFNVVGESFDPLVRQEIEGDSYQSLARAMSHLSQEERDMLTTSQANEAGPGYTFLLSDLHSLSPPRLSDSFGYRDAFNYPQEVLYNTFRARKTGGRWTIGDQQIIKRNDYKIPVRILITQVMDSNDVVLSSYVKTVIPEILDFNDRSKDSRRSQLIGQAFSKICNDFVDSINSTYELLRQDGEVEADYEIRSDRSQNIARMTFSEYLEDLSDPVNRYAFVKRFVSDFPVFCRTSKNRNPSTGGGIKNSVLSVSKLYSVASQLEVSQETGNFTNDQSEIDSLFSRDRGLLVKRSVHRGIEWDPTNVRSEFSPSAIQDWHGPDRISYADVQDLLDELAPHLHRQYALAYNNLHSRDITHSPLSLARTVSNIITWFQQRRSESFWGLTYNISDPAVNRTSFQSFNRNFTGTTLANPNDPSTVIEYDTGVSAEISTQLPIEEYFYRSGNSMFVADKRTYDFQLFELLSSEYSRSGADIQSYEQFRTTLNKMLTYVEDSIETMSDFYGDFVESQRYIDNFVTFANELMPTMTEFKRYLSDMKEFHEDYGNQVALGPINAGTGVDLPDYPYYRKTSIPWDNSQYAADGFAYIKRSLSAGSQLSDLHGSGPIMVPGNHENELLLGRLIDLSEFQYQNLQSIRDSRQNITLNYNAALGPQGLDVLEDVIDILASYNTVDEDGNPQMLNLIRGSKIIQGLRLMHNLDTTDASPVQFEMVKYGLLAQINTFQQEERQGLMRLPSQTGRLGSVFTSEVASYEREVASIDCWSRGESFLDVFYNMDDFMIDELKKTTEYKAYNELCFPAKKYAAIMTAHSTSLLGGYNTMPSVLVSSKDVMASIFSLMTSGTDFEKIKFGSAFTNIELRNMIDEGISSEGPDECFSAPSLGKWYRIVSEMVQQMIKRFPGLVLRGIADQIDPAYKEIKTHWMNCQLDGFAWQGKDRGQVITPISRRSKLTTGVHKPGEDGTYAPVNVAFPVDLTYGIARLIDLEPEFLAASIAKLIQYIGTGNLPLIDPSYAFQIPCKDIDVSGDSAFSEYTDRFDIGQYGRYGHSLSIFTVLALSTPVLPGDRRMKEQRCEINDLADGEITYCPDDEES